MDGRDTSANQVDQYPIYVGIWINWSRGRVMGSTLTLSRRDADLVIAFTAFFIAFVASRVWRIICFVFHRAYSTADPRDAIYHQRQTIFRHSSTPESGIWMLLCLSWANRHSKGWLGPLPAVIVASFCISLFTIAGGFSSQISTAVGDEVLIKSTNCGYTSPLRNSTNPLYFNLLSDHATAISSAANYAQQCYSKENAGLFDCNRFAIQQVPKSVDDQASFPFKSHLCRNGSANLRIDSGYLDSHDIFGFNAPPDERIRFRNVLHCAPLTTTGFTYERNSSRGKYTFYQYGSFIVGSTEALDYVHAAPSVESQYVLDSDEEIIIATANYVLNAYFSSVLNETTFKLSSSFVPVDDMFRKDADLSLFFLSGNGVRFSQFSHDEWYDLDPAPASFILSGQGSNLLPSYISKEPASPLACATQYQFCNTALQGTSGCGPLASLRDALVGASPFFDLTYADLVNRSSTSETGARFLYLYNTYFSTASPYVGEGLRQLGAASLTSQNTLTGGIQGPIASNQWQRDIIHLWDISMAIQQSQALGLAYFPDNSSLLAGCFNYTAPEFQKPCNNQKIRTRAYASFSLFGLLFTLAAGLLLTVVSFLVEPISSWLHKRKGHNKHPHLEWTTNSTLQLQRLAHEEIGFGTWSEGTETIPVTKPGELLSSLDISDPKHPILRRPMDGNGTSLIAESSAEGPPTVTGDVSEQTDASLAPSDGASDAQSAVDMNLLDGPTSNGMRIEGGGPTAEPRTELPSALSLPLKHTRQPVNPENLQNSQGVTETPIFDSMTIRAQH